MVVHLRRNFVVLAGTVGIVRIVVLTTVVAGAGCPAPAPLSSLGTAVLTERTATETIDATGGNVILGGTRAAYVLSVPPGALETATDIGVQEIDVTGVDGEKAVRFTPDGLAFANAATLTIDPAPAGDVVVGFTFGDDPNDAALVLATYDEEHERVSLPIEHFSSAGAAERDIAKRLFGDDDDDDLADAIADREESIALGFGEELRRVVDPAVKKAGNTTAQWRVATDAVDRWRGKVVAAGVGGEKASIRGGETLDQAFTRVDDAITDSGRELVRKLQAPRCEEPGNEIGELEDWVRLRGQMIGDLLERSIDVPPGSPCVKARLTVTGTPTELTSSTSTVTLDCEFRLVFVPDENVSETMDRTLYSFTPTGASGPDDFESRNGLAPDIVFTRPAGETRPRAVIVVVTAASGNTDLGAIDGAQPVTFSAAEPLATTATATPALITEPGARSQICAQVTSGGEAVQRFDVRFSTAGPGIITATTVHASTGAACAAFIAPARLPSPRANTVVNARVTVDGVVLNATATVALERPSGAHVDIVALEGRAMDYSETLTFNAVVTDDAGNPVANAPISWSATSGSLENFFQETNSEGVNDARYFADAVPNGAVEEVTIFATAIVNGVAVTSGEGDPDANITVSSSCRTAPASECRPFGTISCIPENSSHCLTVGFCGCEHEGCSSDCEVSTLNGTSVLCTCLPP